MGARAWVSRIEDLFIIGLETRLPSSKAVLMFTWLSDNPLILHRHARGAGVINGMRDHVSNLSLIGRCMDERVAFKALANCNGSTRLPIRLHEAR